jgi:hypothetical protein
MAERWERIRLAGIENRRMEGKSGCPVVLLDGGARGDSGAWRLPVDPVRERGVH